MAGCTGAFLCPLLITLSLSSPLSLLPTVCTRESCTLYQVLFESEGGVPICHSHLACSYHSMDDHVAVGDCQMWQENNCFYWNMGMGYGCTGLGYGCIGLGYGCTGLGYGCTGYSTIWQQCYMILVCVCVCVCDVTTAIYTTAVHATFTAAIVPQL